MVIKVFEFYCVACDNKYCVRFDRHMNWLDAETEGHACDRCHAVSHVVKSVIFPRDEDAASKYTTGAYKAPKVAPAGYVKGSSTPVKQ